MSDGDFIDRREKVICITIGVLTALILAGAITLSVLHFNYCAHTNIVFNKGIFENQDVGEKMIVINPNGKPEFVVAREINANRMLIIMIINGILFGISGVLSVVVPMNIL